MQTSSIALKQRQVSLYNSDSFKFYLIQRLFDLLRKGTNGIGNKKTYLSLQFRVSQSVKLLNITSSGIKTNSLLVLRCFKLYTNKLIKTDTATVILQTVLNQQNTSV